MNLLEKHTIEIKKLCEKHHVSDLYAFGSVLDKGFSEKSDVDLLVTFDGVEPTEYFDNFMDLKQKMEGLFLKNVDLVESQTIKNPVLKRSINRNKLKLYGREDSKVVV